MQCQRCSGIMVSDRFMDIFEDLSMRRFNGWRCINCGEVLDPLIISNRIQPPEPRPNRARRKRKKSVKTLVNS